MLFIINGRDMKSYNQHYNERLAYLRSRLPKNQYTSKQIKRLSKERDCYFNNKFHKIINYKNKIIITVKFKINIFVLCQILNFLKCLN